MKELVTEILAPLVAALNNIAQSIRETSGTPPLVTESAPAEEAPKPAKAKGKAKETAPAPKEPETPAAPETTLASLVDLAKKKLNKESGAYEENLPKIKAFLAGLGIPKVTETPKEKITEVYDFLESLADEGDLV